MTMKIGVLASTVGLAIMIIGLWMYRPWMSLTMAGVITFSVGATAVVDAVYHIGRNT